MTTQSLCIHVQSSTKDGLCSIQLLPLVSVFDHHVHFLIVETAQASNRSTLDRWSSVEPHDILAGLAINNYIIVFCLTLVRTLCCRFAGTQYGIVNGGQWHVVADWKASLVELHTRVGFCDSGAFERDSDATRRVQDVDALERVFGVHEDGGVFFKPLV